MKFVNEDFIAFIWKNRLIPSQIISTNNLNVEIVSTGYQNFNAGPDFLNAKIKINNTLWAGNVEIHVKASDWIKHNHNSDPNFDNIILHVVYEADFFDQSNKHENFTTIEIKSFISEETLKKYFNLINSQSSIPCQKNISQISFIKINPWLNRIAVERLENKTTAIKQLLSKTAMDWETTFYIWFVSSFGMKLNNTAFQLLANSLSLKTLIRHSENTFQIEALLYGQAGLLEYEFVDEYPNSLKNEYNFLATKYTLKSINPSIWKFMRTRPDNFPTVRISQLANILKNFKLLLAMITNSKADKSNIYKLLNTEASEYWLSHSVFDKISDKKRSSRKLGNSATDSLVINAIIPFIFLYGKFHNNEDFIENAIDILQSIEAEDNKIIRTWKSLNINAENALESQALIELYNSYCSNKLCLNCSIGASIMLDIN